MRAQSFFFFFSIEEEKSKDERVEYIKLIHDYLCQICKDSHLEGLLYYGGPEIQCTKCCKYRVLRCVTYNNGKANSDTLKSPKCHRCRTKYDTGDLLVSS